MPVKEKTYDTNKKHLQLLIQLFLGPCANGSEGWSKLTCDEISEFVKKVPRNSYKARLKVSLTIT